DLRADRQPEFTQVDIETAFLTSDEIMELVEGMMEKIMKDVLDIKVQLPFEKMAYDEAMNRFGSDKPDTRFGMELIHVSEIIKDTRLKVVIVVVASGYKVALLNVKGQEENNDRGDIEYLIEIVADFGAEGLAWMRVKGNELTGTILKFLSDDEFSGS